MNDFDVLKFIMKCIDLDLIELYFNKETFNSDYKSYNLCPIPIKISKEFLDDIIANPNHYRKFIKDVD